MHKAAFEMCEIRQGDCFVELFRLELEVYPALLREVRFNGVSVMWALSSDSS